MKIRFETTIDDFIAFNRFHYANSPTWRRQVWTRALLVPVLFGGVYIWACLTWRPIDDDAVQTMGIVFLAAAIPAVFFVRWFLNAMLEYNTHKFLSEGSNRLMFGWREMELVDNRLILNTELIHSSLDLRAIEKIVHSEQYTFVYIAAAQAYLIPMNLYPEEEYREFVDELREAWDNRDDPTRQPQAIKDERIVERPH